MQLCPHLTKTVYPFCKSYCIHWQVEAGYNERRGCYEICTLNPYKKYNQVFISYGNHDNYHLLVEYGFTLPENPNDVVQVDYGKKIRNVNFPDSTLILMYHYEVHIFFEPRFQKNVNTCIFVWSLSLIDCCNCSVLNVVEMFSDDEVNVVDM